MLTILLAAMMLGQGEVVSPPTKTYTPDKTRVAILPVLNTSGEKWKELRVRQEKAAATWLTETFTTRGFVLVPAEQVTAAVKDLKLDFLDEEVVNRANILKVGAAVKADLVELTILTDTRQDGSGFGQSGYGVAELKSWLLDVKAESPIFSARSATARSARASFKTSDRQVWAVPLALSDTFKEFLLAYPEVKGKVGSGG